MKKAVHQKIRKDEYKRLQKEINRFNRYLAKISNKENRSYLPSPLEYEHEKAKLGTRQALNRRLNELKKFYQADATKKVTLESGNEMTEWEYKLIKKPKQRALKRLNKELKELETPKEGEKYSRAQMGSIEANVIKRKISDILDFGKIKYIRQAFRNLVNRIFFQGSQDYELKRATTYRENILRELKVLGKNDDDYKLLYEEFKQIKNPHEFYKMMKKSTEMQNFFEWYQNPDHFGGFIDRHDIATSIMNTYGIKTKKKMKFDKKYKNLSAKEKSVVDKYLRSSSSTQLNPKEEQIVKKYIKDLQRKERDEKKWEEKKRKKREKLRKEKRRGLKGNET